MQDTHNVFATYILFSYMDCFVAENSPHFIMFTHDDAHERY